VESNVRACDRILKLVEFHSALLFCYLPEITWVAIIAPPGFQKIRVLGLWINIVTLRVIVKLYMLP